jgi:hypothetical protein
VKGESYAIGTQALGRLRGLLQNLCDSTSFSFYFFFFLRGGHEYCMFFFPVSAPSVLYLDWFTVCSASCDVRKNSSPVADRLKNKKGYNTKNHSHYSDIKLALVIQVQHHGHKKKVDVANKTNWNERRVKVFCS